MTGDGDLEKSANCEKSAINSLELPKLTQPTFLRIIAKIQDRPVPYALHSVIDDIQGHQEPLAGFHQMAEAIRDREADLRGCEDLVDPLAWSDQRKLLGFRQG